MKYVAVAVMWASIAAIAIFGGGDGGFVAIILGMCASGVSAAVLTDQKD